MYTNNIPKMSPQYVSSMITFKSHLIRQKQAKKQNPNKFHSILEVKHKLRTNRSSQILIKVDLLVLNNCQGPRRKLPKAANSYINCIDKIYGKMFREREELENILIQFDKLQQNKQTILNTQQKEIQEEIFRINKKKRAENNLMEKIAKDFQKEIRKDPDQVVREYKLSQRLHRQVSNKVLEEIFNKKSDLLHNRQSSSDLRTKNFTTEHGSLNSSSNLIKLDGEMQLNLKQKILELDEHDNNQSFYDALKQIKINKNVKINTYRERVLEAFKSLPPHLQTDNISITNKQRLEKLKLSLNQARGLVSERKSRQAVFRTQLDHEKKYLEEGPINDLQINIKSESAMKESVIMTSPLRFSSQKFIQSENRSPRELATTLFSQLNENCNEQDINCKKVIKLFKRKQKGFIKKYQVIKNTHSKFAN